MRRASLRFYENVRNSINDVHKNFANFLCQNYKVVLVPTYETSNMVDNTNANRKLHSKVVRRMMVWSHYRFKQHLLQRARVTGTLIVEVEEYYTSQTCGMCGTLNKKEMEERTFECEHCGLKLDRDMNGSRNILLRYLTINNINIV